MAWSLLAPISLCAYAYSVAIKERRYADITVSAAFFFAELVWEMANALVGHFAGAPLWSLAEPRIYIGLNVEIALMFAVFPLVVLNVAESTPRHRWLISAVFGAICIAVETTLNHAGLLAWHWWFWRPPHLWLVFVAYSVPAWIIMFVRERTSETRQRQILVVSIAVALACHLTLRHGLGWV